MFCGSLVWAGEKDEAELAKAPSSVQAAAKKLLGSRKLDEFGKERLGRSVIYEIGFKADDKDHAYVLGEAGELIQEEVDVDVADLPAPVTSAINKAVPSGKLDEAAIATNGAMTFYVVEVKVGAQVHCVSVTQDGKFLADEVVEVMHD